MKLLQLTQLDDSQLFIKPEALTSFGPYDDGSSIELFENKGYIVKESPKTILALLNIVAGGSLTVIDSSDITI